MWMERPASLPSEHKFGPNLGTKLGEKTWKSRNSCSLIGGGVEAQGMVTKGAN